MPFFKIETNVRPDSAEQLLEKATEFIAEVLGKPEKFVMVCLETEKSMNLGNSAEPLAFVSLKSIGLAKERCAELSSKVCGFMDSALGISGSRVFIDFHSLDGEMFGWDSKTFRK